MRSLAVTVLLIITTSGCWHVSRDATVTAPDERLTGTGTPFSTKADSTLVEVDRELPADGRHEEALTFLDKVPNQDVVSHFPVPIDDEAELPPRVIRRRRSVRRSVRVPPTQEVLSQIAASALHVRGIETNEKDGPLVYRNEDTGVIFYVESDRRHVSALAPNGTLLWHYLEDRFPPITRIGPYALSDGRPYVAISYGRAWGCLDQETGKYYFIGSD